MTPIRCLRVKQKPTLLTCLILLPCFTTLLLCLYVKFPLNHLLHEAISRVEQSVTGLWTRNNNTLHVDRFVSFEGGFKDGRRLGNQMFNLAAVVYVAELTGREPAILKYKYSIMLDNAFDLGIERFSDLCPCYVFKEKAFSVYDPLVEELANGSLAELTRGKSIFLDGFFQSWKYFRSVELRLRQLFTFRPEIRQFVGQFLEESTPPGWITGYIRVGVHVRRGDMTWGPGDYTSAPAAYFIRAMSYFIDRLESRIQFVVASDDIDWCLKNFADFATKHGGNVSIVFSVGHSASQDIALLASCQHVIMSTGTFGWWAAWLARGITVYYTDYPKNGSKLQMSFSRRDFFPPNWIGMT